jgi:hypothetical protein
MPHITRLATSARRFTNNSNHQGRKRDEGNEFRQTIGVDQWAVGIGV